MAKQLLATLLTDFGTREAYPAAMKGVILSVCPQAQVVDMKEDALGPAEVVDGWVRLHLRPNQIVTLSFDTRAS